MISSHPPFCSHVDYEAIRRFLRPSARAILHHGSTALGIGHSSSDIDLLAITDSDRFADGVELESGIVQIVYVPAEELRTQQLDEYLSKTSPDGNLLVGRLASAEIVHDPFGLGARVVEDFKSWVPPREVLIKKIFEARHLLNDAQGAFDSGEAETAEICLRLLAHTLAAIELLDEGVSVLSTKWQFKLLTKFRPSVVPVFVSVVGLNMSDSHFTRLRDAVSWMSSWEPLETEAVGALLEAGRGRSQ